MLRRLGGDVDRLSRWAGGVLTDWQKRVNAGEAVAEGDDFAFWRARWSESFAKPPTTGERHVEGVEETERLLRERRAWVKGTDAKH